MYRAAWWTCAFLTFALVVTGAYARIYHRCELARDLRNLGVHPDHISTWVCIAYHESRFNTAANNPHSGDHGIFQISELYWCGVGKACNLPCAALRDDEIADDLECALTVHEEHTRLQGDGFLAWVVYPQHCKQSTKKYLIDCDESFKNASVSPGEGRAFVAQTPYVYTNQYRTNPIGSIYSANNPNIDNLLPPYLAITSIFRGSYGKVLDYNKINSVDWYNYKYDKVDELKLPNSVRNAGIAPPSTTASTTNTTYVPAIKPWRFVETNQFRKKISSSDRNSIKSIDYQYEHPSEKNVFSYSTREPPKEAAAFTSVTTDIAPKVKPTIASYKSPVTLTSTIKAMNSTDTAYKWPAFTASYKSRSTTYKPSTITYGSSTRSINNYLTSTIGHKSLSSTTTVKPTLSPLVFTFAHTTRPTTVPTTVFTYSTRATTTSKSPNFSVTSVKPPITYTFTSRTKAFGSPTTASPFSQYVRTGTTPGDQHSSRAFLSTTNQKSSITSTNTKPTFFKNTTSQYPTYSFFPTTTRKPVFLTTSSSQRPTLFTIDTKKTSKSSTTTKQPVSQKTSRTTQNIFDVYLNPTKPPKLVPFSFSSRSDNKFKINIFSDGTTASPSLKNNSYRRT